MLRHRVNKHVKSLRDDDFLRIVKFQRTQDN